MKKVVVIGGGASGMMAAIKAAENNEVILIEGNDKCGKKLLITGNGKCNYWNENISLENYFTDDEDKLLQILESKNEVLDFLYKLGIFPKIKNGYYYPYSSQASSVREILVNALERNDVKVLCDTRVKHIIKKDNQFLIKTDYDEIKADSIIIATGSRAASKTGSDGWAYDIAKGFGHSINPVLPALVQLQSEGWFLKDWNGVRHDARLSLYVDDELAATEEGELQLTQDGISGICTFNISSIASRALYENKNVKVKINFSPFLDGSFYNFFEERANIIPNQSIGELLESILNYKLINVILHKSNLVRGAYWKSLTNKEKEILCNNVDTFEIDILGTNNYEKGQVCTGGVSLSEVDNNMQSKLCDNLYLVGELLDVDGKCGGFNLAFAFISGYLAGKDI